jgi:isoquinoline 1-oxidoreductase beta subunit
MWREEAAMNAPVKSLREPTRRDVMVVASVAAGGSLLIGCSQADILSIGADSSHFGPFGPFLRIAPDGSVTVISKHIELGQGSSSGLAAIVAEELDADWNNVSVEMAEANAKVYQNSGFGAQGTGGSSAINNSWDQLRAAGAAGRAMFVTAAAQKWNVPAGEVTVKDGVVSHRSGKQASFADLLADAAKVTPPKNPPLKDPKAFTLIGTDRVRRKDARAKSTGKAQYTQDVHKPDMLTAMVAHSPRFGGKVKHFDDAAARKIPGVVDVFQIPTGVAVVAQNTWAARQGRDALNVEWDDAKAEMRGSDAILASYHALAAGHDPGNLKWQVFDQHGQAAPEAGGKVIEATYDFPFLAHAPMEPMNCVAEIGKGDPKITTGSQIPTMDQLNTALIAGCLPGSVKVETLFAGGSFGRRANFKSDYVSECAHIAKHVGGGRPVKLVWTREDDMTAGYYRPMAHHALRVTLGADGFPQSWRHRVVCQSIMKGAPTGGGKLDTSTVEGTQGSPYLKATPNVDGQVIMPDSPVTVLWWRSVGATHNAFVMEHTIDQCARAAGQDPVEYRRALYKKVGDDADRHLAVLNLLMDKAGPVTPGWSRGVAVHESFGSVVAQAAEVQLDGPTPRVGRVVTAIDCGLAVSPDQVAAQMEGGTCYGLSAALYGQITLKDGLVQQKNFDAYRVLRMHEAPQVETWILPSNEHPTGVGEPGTPVIAPAVANALLALNGQRTTGLPFVKA